MNIFLKFENKDIKFVLNNYEVLDFSYSKIYSNYAMHFSINLSKVALNVPKAVNILKKWLVCKIDDQLYYSKISAGLIFDNKEIKGIIFPDAYINSYQEVVGVSSDGHIIKFMIMQKADKAKHVFYFPSIAEAISETPKSVKEQPQKLDQNIVSTPNIASITIHPELKQHAGVYALENENTVCSEDPVNLSTGNFVYVNCDIFVEGKFPISLFRTYNSIDDFKGSYGFNWHHNYEIFLDVLENNSINITFDDGHVENFVFDKDNIFRPKNDFKKFIFFDETLNTYILKYINGFKYIFDFSGKIIERVDSNDNSTFFYYENNQNNLLTNIKTISGELFFTYNSNNLIETAYDNKGQIVSYNYIDNNLEYFIDIFGNSHKYIYDENTNRLFQISNPLGNNIISNTYNKDAKVLSQTFPDNTNMKYDYDKVLNKVDLFERNGAIFSYFHDEKFRIFKEVHPNGTIEKKFDENNNLIEYIDKNKNKSSFYYNKNSNITKKIDPLLNETEYIYGLSDKLIKIIKSDNSQIRYKYDYKGNLVSEIDSMDNITDYTYNEFGLITSICDPNKNFSYNKYDKKGNLIEFVDCLQNKYIYQYDDKNRLIKIIFPEDNIKKFEYYLNGNIKKIYNGYDAFCEYCYDACQNIISFRDFRGNTSFFEYNSLNLMIKQTDALGGYISYEYDTNQNIISITNDQGLCKTFEYDSTNNLLSKIDESGNKSTFEYDANSNLISRVDAMGFQELFFYDALDNIVKFTNKESFELKVFYDKNNNITKKIDPMGFEENFEYDFNNRLLKYSNSMNFDTYYTYDNCDNLISIQDPAGNITKYEYNALNQIISVIDALNNKTTISYTKNNKIKQITNAINNTTYYSYDSNNNLFEYTKSDGNSYTYYYDDNNNLTKIIDPKNNSKNFEYDELNRKISFIDESGNVSKVKYNSNNQIIEFINTEGAITSYEYNNTGQISKIIDALGNQTTLIYDCLYRLIEQIDHNNCSTKFKYTPLDMICEITNTNNKTIQYFYNKNGNLIKEVNASSKEYFYEHDKLGRVIKVIDPLGNYETFTYDPNDNITSTTDKNNNTTKYRYDACGNVIEIINALGHSTHLEYDAINRITKVILNNNTTTSSTQTTLYEYNGYNLITKIINTDLSQKSFVYDENGNLLQKIDEDGFITEYAYDSKNLLKFINYNNEKKALFYYNKLGNLVLTEDWLGKTSFEFDKLGKIISVIDHNNKSVKYDYDCMGNISKIIYPDNSIINYEYDCLNRLKSVKDSTSQPTTYEYNDDDQLVKLCYPNNVVSNYIYDNMGKVSQINLSKNSKDFFVNKFQYDSACNLINEYKNYIDNIDFDNNTFDSKKFITQSIDYSYDKLNNLIEVCDKQNNINKKYRYDSLGNLIYEENDDCIINYHLNNLNQIVEKTSSDYTQTFEYDKRGNLILSKKIPKNLDANLNKYSNILLNKKSKSSSFELEFVYDATNRMIKGSTNNSETSSYHYNCLGILVCNEHKTKNSSQKIYDYILDYNHFAPRPLMTFENKRNFYKFDYGLSRLSISKLYIDNQKAKSNYIDNQKAKLFFHNDRLNSTIYTTDFEGKIDDFLCYDEWGNQTNLDKNKNQHNNFSKNFTGHPYDDILQMYVTKERFYNPNDKRFVSKDREKGSIQNPKSFISYTYCFNNPNLYVDFLGDVGYIFYSDAGFEGTLEQDLIKSVKSQMKGHYKLKDDEVIVKRIASFEDLKSNWNNMGMVDGKPAPIDSVAILAHGHPNKLVIADLENNKKTYPKKAQISSLENKDVKLLVMISCNVANIDYGENMATCFAKKINNGKVLASDGTVHVNRKNIKNITSKKDEGFLKSRDSLFISEDFDPTNFDENRDNKGFYITQVKEDGTIYRSDDNLKKITMKDAFKKFDPAPTPPKIATESKIATNPSKVQKFLHKISKPARKLISFIKK